MLVCVFFSFLWEKQVIYESVWMLRRVSVCDKDVTCGGGVTGRVCVFKRYEPKAAWLLAAREARKPGPRCFPSAPGACGGWPRCGQVCGGRGCPVGEPQRALEERPGGEAREAPAHRSRGFSVVAGLELFPLFEKIGSARRLKPCFQKAR